MGEPVEAAGPANDSAGFQAGRRGIVASLGAIAAAVLASLCCIGPVLFVTLGVGAGFARQFEPLWSCPVSVDTCRLGNQAAVEASFS